MPSAATKKDLWPFIPSVAHSVPTPSTLKVCQVTTDPERVFSPLDSFLPPDIAGGHGARVLGAFWERSPVPPPGPRDIPPVYHNASPLVSK